MATLGSYLTGNSTTATTSSGYYGVRYYPTYLEDEDYPPKKRPKERKSELPENEQWLRNRVEEICDLVDLK